MSKPKIMSVKEPVVEEKEPPSKEEWEFLEEYETSQSIVEKIKHFLQG
ncbi:MAG: hypothetical protein ACE5DI_00305 [Candidatus Micrarchaeia archaeon]